jgi:predicted transport protein
MTGINTSKSESQISLNNPIKQATDCAIAAYDVSTLGFFCIDQLRTMLRSIVALSQNNELIHDLAKVGVDIADDYCNLLDCEVNDKKKS